MIVRSGVFSAEVYFAAFNFVTIDPAFVCRGRQTANRESFMLCATVCDVKHSRGDVIYFVICAINDDGMCVVCVYFMCVCLS